MKKIKIIFIDGLLSSVMMNQEALDADIDLDIINYDKNLDSRDLLDKEFNETGMIHTGHYTLRHCNTDEE